MSHCGQLAHLTPKFAPLLQSASWPPHAATSPQAEGARLTLDGFQTATRSSPLWQRKKMGSSLTLAANWNSQASAFRDQLGPSALPFPQRATAQAPASGCKLPVATTRVATEPRLLPLTHCKLGLRLPSHTSIQNATARHLFGERPVCPTRTTPRKTWGPLTL